jgi:hypothetical protein
VFAASPADVEGSERGTHMVVSVLEPVQDCHMFSQFGPLAVSYLAEKLPAVAAHQCRDEIYRLVAAVLGRELFGVEAAS